MRREGVVGPHHTNHTVRASRCGVSFTESNMCPVHSHEAVERAYHELLDRTGRHRFSRLDLFEATIELFRMKGGHRTKMYACVTGSCFRKVNRPCSCPQCIDLETKKGKRRDLERTIQEDLKEYHWAKD